MTKMALSTFFPCAAHIDTPSEEDIGTLIGMMRIKWFECVKRKSVRLNLTALKNTFSTPG
jgi:hypothetical protein